MLPQKHFEIFDSQIAGNALELSILLPPRLFYIILNLVRSHRADLSWLLGGEGGAGVRCVCTLPLPTGSTGLII